MRIYPASSIKSLDYNIDSHFSLAVSQRTTCTKIVMHVFGKTIDTGENPFIVDLLREHLPNVLLTKCFNDDNLPFTVEVRNTELGHLFEHILLEYLCQLKIAKGFERAVFEGRTKWNWIKDPKGKFHIRLNCGINDADILPLAIEKTIALMKIIMDNNQPRLFASRRYFTRYGLKNGKRVRMKVKKTSQLASESSPLFRK